MFNHKFSTLSGILIIVAVISLPFAVRESIELQRKIQTGFRMPDYPSEVIDGNLRIPKFKSFDYVYGLKDDDGIKKVLLETYKDGLNFYYNKLSHVETIDYKDIAGLELYEENELKVSTAKSLVYAALLGSMGGMGRNNRWTIGWF